MKDKTKAELLEQQGEDQRQIANLWDQRRDLERQVQVGKQHLAEKDKAIDQLKDQMHGLELTNARLQGIIERVRELDPLSERERRDGASEVAAQLERTASQLRHPMRAGDFDRAVAMAEEVPPYYRRRD